MTLEQIDQKALQAFPNGTYNDTYFDAMQQKRRCGYITGAFSRQPEIDALQERVEKISILLHDLTPGGSEFANDPEYCAKWIRENRLEESKQLKKIIVARGERVKELEEGLKKIANNRFEGLDAIEIATELLTNKPNNNG